ncbi:hypothetical protein Tco_0195788 [Tanacetum coccineum]
MSALEDDIIFDFSSDDGDDGAVVDMNNLGTTIQVSLIPTTRIHKDHPLDQVIGDLQSATQTRKMSKNLDKHGTQKKIIHAIRMIQPGEEAIKKLLQIQDFLVYQMDVKSGFFVYGKNEEEVVIILEQAMDMKTTDRRVVNSIDVVLIFMGSARKTDSGANSQQKAEYGGCFKMQYNLQMLSYYCWVVNAGDSKLMLLGITYYC